MATISGNNRANILAGTAADDVVFGLGGSDRLSGNDGADILYGDDASLSDGFGAGDDRLDGGAGRDLLIGGAGADSLVGGDGDDLLIGGFAGNGFNDGVGFGYSFSPFVDGGNDSYNGGAGIDQAVLIYTRPASIVLDISSPALRAITADGVEIGTIRGIESITAFLGSGHDAVTGSALGDEIHGGAGDDVLSGGGSSDRIDGGAGNDRLSGGEGFDTLSYADATAGVRVDLRLAGVAQDTRGAGIDTIDGFEQVDGSNYSDQLIGTAGNDFMTAGNGGDDRLLGGDGNDQLSIFRFATDAPTSSTLNGGNGDDTITVAAQAGATDRIAVIGGDGADTANVTVSAHQTIDMGAGEDRVLLQFGVGDVAIKLGRGVDTIAFQGLFGVPDAQTAAHIVDFAAGNNGDRIDLRDLLARAADGYQAGSNPFATGYVRLVASETGTALQFDVDGRGATRDFVTILELDGPAPAKFTAFNFGGTDPRASSVEVLPHSDHAWPGLAHLA